MKDYQALNEKTATLALWYVVNASLTAFYKLTKQFGTAKEALCQAQSDWRELGVHTAHIGRHRDVANVMAVLDRLHDERERGGYGILFADDEHYPAMLQEIYDPPPVLFYRGQVARLLDRQLAIVGSRNPTEFAKKMTHDMAEYLVHQGLTITSGLAGGVDKSAHMGALKGRQGQTVGVMGTGIDVCYPKNHNALYAQIIQEGGCLISEFLPATPASKHTFPRRNRLVAGLSLATLVTEATLQSGSLITARLTAEQGKQVFAMPSSIDNTNAEGCHHLIREGATLIYHPSQIVDELSENVNMYNALPKTFSRGVSVFEELSETPVPSQSKTSIAIPAHLQAVFDKLSATPTDLDTLVATTSLDVGGLLAMLMELEMLGVVQVVGGRYAKV